MSNTIRPQPRRGPSGAWNRLRPGGPSDPLDAYGLPSKGETRLHDHKAQEHYYTKIVERYMKFCAASGGGAELEAAFSSLSHHHHNDPTNPLTSPTPLPLLPNPKTPPTTTTTTTSDLPLILLSMRKLREAILATRRTDTFAQRAYMFIIHASILTQAWESYQPALRYLLTHIHATTPLSAPELHEFTAYHVLDLACRQHELAAATAALRAAPAPRDRRVAAVLRALVADDWVAFWRLRRAVDGYRRSLVDFAGGRMRVHALKCVGRAYLQADRAFVERAAGDVAWEDLVASGVAWELQQDSGLVVIRKPRPK